ncbi:nuclear transport factor 2 family protein [Pedobacter sp. SYP-B3415]|uniref:nuclear transport factor 2 family protein n=1 Tax=Pedobacter sp. SYP-B3415 TaxID=2496641 RepID=UPI00101B78CA|nr:nuclear transport factor 2 family protein [Pedobacter sp. SYP-B3415]
MTNKDLLHKANAAITAGNHEEFLTYCTDDTVWEFVGEQTLRGKEAVRRYINETYLEPPEFIVEDLIADGDLLTAVGEISLKEERGETRYYRYCDVWRLRDGKLHSLRAFVIGKSGSVIEDV